MKKLLLLIAALILTVTMLASCSQLQDLINQGGDEYDNLEDNQNGDGEKPEDEKPNDEKPEDEKPEDEKPDDNQSTHLYTSFTPSEKNLLTEVAGGVIPFIANDEYYVEKYYDEYYEEYCVSYYTLGNTKAEFDAYYALFSDYTLVDTYEDDYGDTWYCLEGDTYVEMSFYYYEGDYVVDVYVYTSTENGSGDNGDSGNNGGNTEGSHTYTGFTSDEQALFNQMFGDVIPFISNSEYYVEEYTYDYGDEYEEGINFYAFGNTSAEFNAYRALFSGYTYDGTENDDYGDAWYYYTAKSGYYVDMSYYESDQGYVVDVYVYFLYEGSSGENGGSGNNGSGNNGSGNNGSGNTNANLITNAGAGLPEGTDGVYNVDFTDGKYVKDVTDQGYYLDGCPTVGSPAVLVIPVDFSDINGRNSSYFNIENIVRAFSGEGGDYYSVKDYYYISSYGQLDLDITVINEWFVPKNASTYYENATYDYYGDRVAIGDQLVLDEALAYLSTIMDLSKFDSDNNGIIDSVVLVTTLDIDPETDFYWAYRYWNIYTDSDGYYYEYDGVSANDYLWASYKFIHESYDANDEAIYTDTSVMNTYTFIHEFGHILGVDDYYNTSEWGEHPMDGLDVMDSMMGDHNAFTKFNLGWLTTSRLVTTNGSLTLTLDAFAKNGDTIIIANNFDPTLGAYQEYYIVVYYTQEGLNGGDNGYFLRDGIIVYHVDASLYSEDYDGETYYDIYNNNTDSSDQYGTENNLIEFVTSAEGNYTFAAGDKLPSVTDNNGAKLSYTFTVDALDGDSATITFTKS